MGFYDKFKWICEAKGVAQSRVALDIGLSKSAVIKWKHGDIPKMTTLQKLADYFNVSADYFLDIALGIGKTCWCTTASLFKQSAL